MYIASINNDQDAKKSIEILSHEIEKEKFLQLLDEANSYYEKKNYTKAIELCDQAIDIDKQSFISYLSKANSLLQLSQYKNAIDYYNKVLVIDAHNKEGIKNKEIALESLKKQKYSEIVDNIKSDFEKKNYSNVINLCNTAIEIDSKSSFTYVYKAHSLKELRRYKEAIEWYDKALEINPDNADVKQNKKNATMELKKEEYSALINEIESKYAKKHYPDVVNLSNTAIKIDPTKHLSYLYKGFALEKLQNYEEAIECYDKVLKIEPDNVEVLNKRRKTQVQLDIDTKTAAALKKKKQANKWLIQGDTLFFHQKNYQEALYYYDKVLEIEPDNETAKNKRIIVLESLKKTVFKKSWGIENNPTFIAVDSKGYVYVTIENIKSKSYRKFLREKHEYIHLDGLYKFDSKGTFIILELEPILIRSVC